MIAPEAQRIAAQCRHYAMCKIDYLGTGLCPSGETKAYVSYFPQGRMDLYTSLAGDLVPTTEKLVDIADSCTLCGICDRQCHFVTGLRPMVVMRALKETVDAHRNEGKPVAQIEADSILRELQAIVGKEWATNDPAIRVTYANDPFPLAGPRLPRYVVLPQKKEEIAAVVKLASRNGIPYVARGNGGSVFGLVFTEGIVLDLNRMKKIEIDRDNWTALVEPGVTAFELQKAVYAQGLRVNTAEPAATVCGNIVCTGIFSTWSNAYGTAADNFVNAEFVDPLGQVFHLNEKNGPNAFSFQHGLLPSPGICTQALVKLHPTTGDEAGLLVPFASFAEAVAFSRDLGRRRIGLAVAVLGGHYIAAFLSLSAELAAKIKTILPEMLGIHYGVLVIGDRYALEAVRKMAGTVIDEKLLKILVLGQRSLVEGALPNLLKGLESDRPPFAILCREEVIPLWEAALSPSPEGLAEAVEEDLRAFYRELYSRPEMTSPVWLSMFRIVSARMARHKHVIAFLLYVPLDRVDLIQFINAEFKRVAERHGVEHDYGFLTPLDFGKRGILEYDYYIDHTEAVEREKAARAMPEIDSIIDQLAAKNKGVKSLKYVISQGCSRKEHFLYL